VAGLVLTQCIQEPIDMGMMSPEISTKTMVPLCRQLSQAYAAGIPIVRSIDLVADNTRNRRAQDVLRRMGDELRAGASLSDAAQNHRKHLPHFFVELLGAGETGGRLDIMLADLSNYYEDRLDIQRQVLRSAIYPCIQLVAAWFLGTWALGAVKGLDFSTGGFNLGAYFQHYLLFQAKAMVIFAMVIVACILLARLGVFKWIRGFFATYVWPFSIVTRWFALARFFRSLALLLSSGLNVPLSIERAAGTIGNPYIERDLVKAATRVHRGASLTQAFAPCHSIDRAGREMLLVGEESGKIDESLEKSAQYHLAQGAHAVKVASKLLGILVLLAVAVLVGYIVISFYASFYGGMMDDLGL